MTYPFNVVLSLGSTKTSLTLGVQLIDMTGATVGGTISTGFAEIGAGDYLWTADMADDFVGAAMLYGDGAYLLSFGVEPPYDTATLATAIAADVLAGMGTGVTVAISATQAAQVATGVLAIRSYHTFAQSINSSSTLALNTASFLWLGIKTDANDTDASSIVLIEKTDRLTVLAGAPYAIPAHGTLTVTGSSGAWVITARLDEVATGLLDGYSQNSLVAEVKARIGADDWPIWDGIAVVSRGIVREIA